MTDLLIVLLVVGSTAGALASLGPLTWSAIRTGRMPGFSRPYIWKATPFRFFPIVLGSLSLLVGMSLLSIFVLIMSIHDLLKWVAR